MWLRSIINHIREGCGYPIVVEPTIVYEDNASCLDQVVKGYIKGDRIKHISPKLFYTHELHGKEVNVTKIQSKDNVADLFTKSLPKCTFRPFVHALGMRRLSAVQGE